MIHPCFLQDSSYVLAAEREPVRVHRLTGNAARDSDHRNGRGAWSNAQRRQSNVFLALADADLQIVALERLNQRLHPPRLARLIPLQRSNRSTHCR